MADADVTRILQRVSGGSRSAVDELMSAVYGELRALAESCLQQERPDHTLSATALVHEAYLKLVDQSKAQYTDRNHFFAVAVQAIRRILVDHARTRQRLKRGGGREQLTLQDCAEATGLSSRDSKIDLIDLDDTLARLTELHERQARIVELRFFGGMTIEEIADVLGVSPSTIDADWRMARWWLRRELGKPGSES